MIQKWAKEFEIGHPTIDAHHRYLVLLMNTFYESIKSNNIEKQSHDIIQELEEYALYHFSTEEQLFEHTAYPYIEHHKKYHHDFRVRVQQIKDSLGSNNLLAGLELMEFLSSWFINHILTIDMAILPYIEQDSTSEQQSP